MNFTVGDLPFFKEYDFSDGGRPLPHFGLVLLPNQGTQYKDSALCAVITSKNPSSHWTYTLTETRYKCFSCDSFVCFDRKDLVSLRGLAPGAQPRGQLTSDDLKGSFKKLKKSLFAIKDLAGQPYLRGTIIYEWKVALGMIQPIAP